jgi:hypothetical protein
VLLECWDYRHDPPLATRCFYWALTVCRPMPCPKHTSPHLFLQSPQLVYITVLIERQTMALASGTLTALQTLGTQQQPSYKSLLFSIP